MSDVADFIVGYSFQADEFCPDHMAEIACRMRNKLGEATIFGDCIPDAESALLGWALLIGLDYPGCPEDAYDQSEFPKPITRQQAEHDQGWSEDGKGSTCGVCGLVLTEWDM